MIVQHDLPIQNILAEGLKGALEKLHWCYILDKHTYCKAEINGKYWGKMSFCVELVGFWGSL